MMADIGENMDDFIGTFDEIAAVFKKAKIELVHAGIFRGSGLREEPVIRVFGDLESFVRAAVAFEVKVAFIETCLLSEDDFLLDDLNDEYDDDAGPSESDGVDLRTINTKLQKYSPLIGQAMSYELTIIRDGRLVTFEVQAEPFRGFSEMRESAETTARENIGRISEQRAANRLEEQARSIQTLRDLRKDAAFMARAKASRTTRALVAYVRESVADADELDPTVLTREVAALRDAAMLETAK
jgi:hypothetical protein